MCAIQINGATARVMGREQDEMTPADGEYDAERSLKTQLEVLKSRVLAQRVVQKLKLGGNQQFFKSQEVDPIPPGASPKQLADLATSLVAGNFNGDGRPDLVADLLIELSSR